MGRGNSKAPYGTEYKTVLKASNIKFVKQTDETISTNAPMITRTKGRVYVTVNSENTIKSITYYDVEGKRRKQIDLTHSHDDKELHTHHGYYHDENGTTNLTTKERAMVDRVREIWYNKFGK